MIFLLLKNIRILKKFHKNNSNVNIFIGVCVKITTFIKNIFIISSLIFVAKDFIWTTGDFLNIFFFLPFFIVVSLPNIYKVKLKKKKMYPYDWLCGPGTHIINFM